MFTGTGDSMARDVGSGSILTMVLVVLAGLLAFVLGYLFRKSLHDELKTRPWQDTQVAAHPPIALTKDHILPNVKYHTGHWWEEMLDFVFPNHYVCIRFEDTQQIGSVISKVSFNGEAPSLYNVRIVSEIATDYTYLVEESLDEHPVAYGWRGRSLM